LVHSLGKTGVRDILEAEGDFKVIGEAGTGKQSQPKVMPQPGIQAYSYY
jgi:DNA-binding NarL/FixJ family response regulator